MASSFNTMNDISKSIKLIKECQYLTIGSDYFVVENVSNPITIKIGHGFSEVKLKDTQNNEFILNGNLNKIGQLFKPNNLFEVVSGSSYRLKNNIDTFQSNTEWKEFPTSTIIEQSIDVGVGVSSKIFVEKSSNRVVKFVGNLNKINNLFEEIVPTPVIQNSVLRVEKQRPIKTKTIIGQIGPVGSIGSQGEMGPTGIIGTRGEKGDTGEKGDKGDQGNKGDQGEIGPVGEIGPPGIQGVQGIQGPHGQDGSIGPQGNVGPQGLVGPQGIQGKPGSNGQNGKDGIQGAIGPQGPMGEKGDRGEKGEKGDRGQNGLQGIPGVAGTVGQKGEKGDKGDIGPIGISPVITAEYPVILKEGKISFDAQKLTSLLDQFKNQDIQKAIDSFAKTATPGGGGLGILFLGSRVLKSVNDINFTGSGVTVIQRGKGVEVNIPGGSGGGGAVNKIIAGSGILVSPSGGTGDVTITNLISVKSTEGTIQVANGSDLFGDSGFRYNYSTDGSLQTPKSFKLGTLDPDSFLQFHDGSQQFTAANTFTYGTTASPGFTHGDRWMSSDTGIEYVYVNDGNSPQWVQPTNTSGGQAYSPVYGSFYDTTTQGATLGNTGYAMRFNSTDYSNGISIVSNSRITLDYTGIYNLQFSAQLNKSTASKSTVDIWLRKNGTDISNTNTSVSLAGSDARTVAAWNFFVGVTAGDYLQLMWATDNTNSNILYEAANSIHPATPSIILTVNKTN